MCTNCSPSAKTFGPLEPDIDRLLAIALAQFIDRLQEEDTVGNVDLLDKAAAERIAHPSNIGFRVAAVNGGDRAPDIVNRDEAGEAIIMARAVVGRRGFCHRQGNRPVAHKGYAACRRHQRGGGDQCRTDGQRQRNRQGNGERQRNGGESNEGGGGNGTNDGELSASLRLAGHPARQPQACGVVHAGRHAAGNVTQYAHV